MIREAVKSDIGRRRHENQDAFGLFPDLSLYVVADGMGGHAAGAVASTVTVEAIHHSLVETQNADFTPIVDRRGYCSLAGRRLMIALQQANERVRDLGRANPEMHGMGTTAVAILFDHASGLLAVCHVGDSRVYRVRDDRIEELTEDHTVVQQLLKVGKIGPQDIKSSPLRHLLTQAVGTEDLVQPDLRLELPALGDVYVLSSDGVHDVVDRDEILQVLRDVGPDLDSACTRLIDLANERGGKDNSTVLIVSCEAQPDPPASQSPPTTATQTP